MNVNLLTVFATLALLTRFGHTLHIMGAVRARSVAAVAARSLIGTACLILLTFLIGRTCIRLFDDPSTPSDTQSDARSTALKSWLPRAAALAVIIGIVAALLSCWP